MQSSSFGSLQIGSRGPSVASLQSKLNSALTPSPRLIPDGVFGAQTAQAVRNFQQRNGLTADGVVGPRTAAALGLSSGGAPGPTPGGHAIPVSGRPGGGPPAFVDLSIFNVVVEATIKGADNFRLRVLSKIDFLPKPVFDRVAGPLNGEFNTLASNLRNITRQAVAVGQDPAVFVTNRIREILARKISGMISALQPLADAPLVGDVGSRAQTALRGVMSSADSALANMRNNGQSAQATATRIVALFENIAREIG